jgi:hypothetical protein
MQAQNKSKLAGLFVFFDEYGKFLQKKFFRPQALH